MKQTLNDEQIWQLVTARFEQSMTIPETFFAAESERIAQACWAMAQRFHQGGRLLAFGNGSWATDAQHVSVEFVHPVIVGKRALPALALTNDSATLTGLMRGGDVTMPFSHQLKALGRPQDIALGFSPDGNCDNVAAALDLAGQMGMLTLGLTGGDGGLLQQRVGARHDRVGDISTRGGTRQDRVGDISTRGGDISTRVGTRHDPYFCFVVPTQDPMLIQETHETLYHILWELVHIFFEHEGLL